MRHDFDIPLLFVLPDVDENEFVDSPRELDGRRADELELAEYLDYDLADLGFVGGTSEVVFVDDICFLRNSYWSPGPIDEATAERLTEYVRGQMSDGAGESGYDFVVGGVRYWAHPHVEGIGWIDFRQIDDDRAIPPANPVAIAARKGDSSGVRLGLSQNPDDANRLFMNSPPLYWAIYGENEEIVAALLNAGADADRPNSWGYPPILTCIFQNTIDDATTARLLGLLAEAGADFSIDYDGRSLIDCAQSRQKAASIALLRQLHSGGD